MQIQIINLAPMASPRPRFSKFGTYMPADYTRWKKAFLSEWQKFKAKKIEKHVPIKVEILFHIQPPKSLAKVKKHQEALDMGTIPCVKKPDTDNYIKSVLDALNGHAWVDDGQITELKAAKYYSLQPRVTIRIEELRC